MRYWMPDNKHNAQNIAENKIRVTKILFVITHLGLLWRWRLFIVRPFGNSIAKALTWLENPTNLTINRCRMSFQLPHPLLWRKCSSRATQKAEAGSLGHLPPGGAASHSTSTAVTPVLLPGGRAGRQVSPCPTWVPVPGVTHRPPPAAGPTPGSPSLQSSLGPWQGWPGLTTRRSKRRHARQSRFLTDPFGKHMCWVTRRESFSWIF